MYNEKNKVGYRGFILFFVLLKIAINLFATSHFGFHRDELLHLALGDHLDWGYKEVPPFIGLLAYITSHVFGNSLFAARLFPTIFGGLLVWLTGNLVATFGGRRFAIAIACLSLIFSPAFAASDYLFQPVVFDQFWWVLFTWLIARYINNPQPRFIYLSAIAIGFGVLTKYTMFFYVTAVIISLLFSSQRKLLFNRHTLFALIIAFLFFMPNLIWQFSHHLPFITHMNTLLRTQLDSINPADFAKQQLFVNGCAFFLWFTGLVALLFFSRLHKFQFLAFSYILVFVFLYIMHGKVYYLFGAYPMLFAAGAFYFERILPRPKLVLQTIVMLAFTVPNFIFLPIALPFLSLNNTLSYIKMIQEKLPAMKFAITWEDHKQHPLTQDYADMLGWDEMTQKVAKVWQSLSDSDRKHSYIYTDNYGEAGAIHHFGKQYQLPEVISMNGSFALWAPDSIAPVYIIYVSDDNDISDLKNFVEGYERVGTIDGKYARENGTGIFLISHPKPEFAVLYRKKLLEKRDE